MISKPLIVTATFFLATLALEPAFAIGSMRCGNHIISTGELEGPGMYEVLKKCGEPTERFGNTWIYQRSGDATRTLHFNPSGTLTRIE